MKRRDAQHKKGFTLIELLVVIAIIGILAALVFPGVRGAMNRAKATKLINAARQMHTACFSQDIFANQDVGVEAVTVAFPIASDGTSTEYFKGIAPLMNVDYSFFSGPGLATAKAEADFDANANAWKVVAELTSDSLASIPWIFTRNIELASLGAQPELDATQDPLRGIGGVYGTVGGSCGFIEAKDLTSEAGKELFDPLGTAAELGTTILAP